MMDPKPASRLQRILYPLLHLPMPYKILIANSALIFIWASVGTWLLHRYFHAFPFGGPAYIALAAALAASIFINFILIRVAVSPMLALSEFVTSVSRGNFKLRAKHHPLGEKHVDRCVDSINRMLDTLEQMFKTLEMERERSRGMTKQIILAQEKERKRVARELHDETSQALTALMLGLEQLQRGMPDVLDRCAGCRHDVTQLKALADKTIVELHRLAFNLRPSLLDDMGLKSALSWLAREQAERHGVNVTFDSGPFDERLPDEVQIALFRVAQEALNNIMKYANAKQVKVSLSAESGAVALAVSDDGIGFNPAEVAKNKDYPLGIFGMKERIALLSGTFKLESTPGEGTKIHVTVPVKREEPRT